ncbi:hypothetical protein [Gordonia soli]|uniref:hypothetical protein n=1 Tax=Gordonia soli TaxID=320799 RepID=UPI000347C020|nr:hypothetical protein [Gordonia soli]
MLLPARVAEAIAAGDVDLAFRRWSTPRVKVGSRFTTSAGIVEVTSVEPTDVGAITVDEARRAGFPTVAKAVGALRKNDDPVYRVGLRWAAEDPRIALRNDADLSDDDVADLTRRLERLDTRSTHGPWTRAVLEMIDRRPAIRAADLAAEFGRETQPFKLDVRKLKTLGLTHSLEVGYELAPRGRELLGRLRTADD